MCLILVYSNFCVLMNDFKGCVCLDKISLWPQPKRDTVDSEVLLTSPLQPWWIDDYWLLICFRWTCILLCFIVSFFFFFSFFVWEFSNRLPCGQWQHLCVIPIIAVSYTCPALTGQNVCCEKRWCEVCELSRRAINAFTATPPVTPPDFQTESGSAVDKFKRKKHSLDGLLYWETRHMGVWLH